MVPFCGSVGLGRGAQVSVRNFVDVIDTDSRGFKEDDAHLGGLQPASHRPDLQHAEGFREEGILSQPSCKSRRSFWPAGLLYRFRTCQSFNLYEPIPSS